MGTNTGSGVGAIAATTPSGQRRLAPWMESIACGAIRAGPSRSRMSHCRTAASTSMRASQTGLPTSEVTTAASWLVIWCSWSAMARNRSTRSPMSMSRHWGSASRPYSMAASTFGAEYVNVPTT